MFTQEKSGKAKEAIETYTKIFPNSKIEMIVPYEKGEGDKEGFIKHSRFTLDGQEFMAIDSSGPHEFIFNEAISFIVHCDTQKEIDYFWGKLSAVPESEQCGWCKDKFGLSWQIIPKRLMELLGDKDREKAKRVANIMLKQHKIVVADLEKAYESK